MTAPQIQTYPSVWVDEGWIAEPAHTWATTGSLGNPSHGSLHRYDDRLYWMGPVQFVPLAALDWLGIDPLLGGRWLSLIFGALGLMALIALARQVLIPGALPRRIPWALTWLALAFTLDPLLWKVHRTIRFESLTGAMTLLAIALAWNGTGRRRLILASFCGAAALWTHPNGIFALVGVAGLVVWRATDWRQGIHRLLLVAGTVFLASLPCLAYFFADRSADFANVLGQNAPHLVGRSAPIIVQWLREPARYASAFPLPYLALPLLAVVATLVLSFAKRAPGGLRWMLVMLIVGLACLPNKTELYVAQLTPFVLLAAVWVGTRWGRGWIMAGIGVLWLGNLAAADVGLLLRNRDCDYAAWGDTLREAIPSDSSVGGSFLAWFPLRDRTFLEIHRNRAGDLADARPDYLVLGDHHFEDPLFERLRAELVPFAAEHGVVVAEASSPCYGSAVVVRMNWSAADPEAFAGWERYGESAAGIAH